GHATILVVQKWATWVFGAMNLVILVVRLTTIDWSAVVDASPGSTAMVITGIGTIAAGTGIGWANSGAAVAGYQAATVAGCSRVLSAAAGVGIPLVVMISMGLMVGASPAAVAVSAPPMDAIRVTLPSSLAVAYLANSFIGLL